MRRLLALGLLAALPLVQDARADENADLDMIPGAVATAAAPPAETAPAGGKLSLENAAGLSGLRPLAVPLPGRTPPRWGDRTSLDGRWEWNLGHDVRLNVSDRLDVFARDGLAFGQGRTAANNLREAYLTWEAAPRLYVEAGRINVRNGVALGFNPTDYFRAGSAVDQATADPSALRENRLGTMMLRGQHIAEWGSVSFAYAPKLFEPARIGQGATAPLDPHLDRTNAAARWLLTLHPDLGDIAPELLVFNQSGRTSLGANLTAPVGQQIVAYAEWSGGAAQGLAAEAIGYGIRTFTLPSTVRGLAGTAQGFRNDLAVGFAWTGESKVTVNLEYLFHEAGFSRTDWRRWYAAGRSSPLLAGVMWYERGYAADQQYPAGRQQMFVRASWPDAIARDIDLTALSFVSLDDGSALAQVSANWNIDRQWSAAAYLAANLGPPRSIYGSLKSAISATAQVVRYF